MSETGDSVLQPEPNLQRANYSPQTAGPIPAPTDAPHPPSGVPAAGRGVVRTIHYNLSYIVRNAERGPRGAIVLLHDFPGGAFSWEPLLAELDATGRAVYAFDLLTYGQSDHPWPSDVSIWGHADDLTFAFEALRLTDIVLVGIGIGGAVAQVLATRTYRPDVAQLVLVNSYGYSYAFAPSWPLPDMAARQDPEAPHHTKLEDLMAALRATFAQAAAKPDVITSQQLAAYLDQYNSNLGKELIFQQIRLLLPNYQLSVASDIARISAPLLLVWGERDAVTPLSIGQRMAREVRGARLEVLPDVGHLLLDEAAGPLARVLTDFVAHSR